MGPAVVVEEQSQSLIGATMLMSCLQQVGSKTQVLLDLQLHEVSANMAIKALKGDASANATS